MTRVRTFILTLMLLFMAVPASAAEAPPETFAVLPFSLHGPEKYQYLEQGIPSMLVSRLTWQDRFHPMDQSRISATSADIDATAAAARILNHLGADYLIWGSVTILGEECSLDVKVLDEEGNLTPSSVQTSLDQLIPSLENVSKEINARVFQRIEQAPARVESEAARPLNPELVYNQAGPNQFYINPEFQYAGDTEAADRWRSQALDFSGLGMVVGDADADGNNEVFVLDDHKVYAFRLLGGQLKPLGVYEGSARSQCLNINLLDLNRDGYIEIIVSAAYDDDAYSFILNFMDGQFKVVHERIPLLLNVVRTPPDFLPVLVGQRMGPPKIFVGEVHEVVRSGGEFTLGRELKLPQSTNIFDFAYLPVEGNDYKIIATTQQSKLRVYSSTGQIQAVTEELYAGSSLGIEMPSVLPGMGQRRPDQRDPDYYFIPSRMVPINLDRDNRFELLVNRNISVSAQFLTRYRFFPQGEIHNLYWDGIGLNILWKTRRIKGSIVDYGVADIDNDGELELYVCVNTHPGVTGFTTRRTVIVAYALDIDEGSSGSILRPVQE